MHLPDVLAAVRAAGVGEVSWTDRGGRLQVGGVVPLVAPTTSSPVLALPYGEVDLARSIAAARTVVLSLTESRATSSAWQPVAVRCTPRLTEDREGDRFSAELLEQELVKYPPSRLLADSVMLRRENWWWLPRLIIDLEVEDAASIAPRSAPTDHLLVTSDAVRTVGVDTSEVSSPRVVSGADGVAAGPAVLFGQDLSLPDMEEWAQWGWRGEWDGEAFTAASVPDRIGLPSAAGLRVRWRRQRALEKACRRGLAAATGS